MEFLVLPLFLACAWLHFALPAGLITLPFWWYGRRRGVHWTRLDRAVLVVPFLAWGAMSLTGFCPGGKSFSNLVVELPLAGLYAALVPPVRLALQGRYPDRLVAAAGLVFASVMAAAVSLSFPLLRE